jgi:two-component system CheB/CheR fusion protein
MKNDIDMGKETDRLLLTRFISPGVLVNSDFQIVRFFGDTANYLQPAAGKASLHILKMVKDEMVFELRSLLIKARKQNVAVKHDGIQVTINDTLAQLSIEIVPLKELSGYFLIVFKEKIIIPVPVVKTRGKSNANELLETRINQLEFQLKESRSI